MASEESSDGAVSLPPKRVAEMLEAGEVLIIDIREAKEWEHGRVPGARHFEIDEVSLNADSIDKSKPVVFQCRTGSRSEMVAAAFRQSGWDAYNMEDGLRAWEEQGLPLEPDGGHIDGA
jgi:rhodanese-related sulfurtransferase